MAICLSGCSSDVNELFNKKAIEIHSKSLIRDISRIPLVPDVNNPLPEIYQAEPRVITVSPEDTKLYYFTRNHTPDKLAGLIISQLGYKVDQLPATNQLIIKCPNEKDAQITLDFLQQIDVPPIQVRIDCLISELFADSTMDWETSLEIGDLFGTGDGGAKTVSGAIANAISLTGGGSGTPPVAFPGASTRALDRSDSGLQIGFEAPGGTFKAVVDILASRGYLKIVMNPVLRTVNGKPAKIETIDYVPVIEYVDTTAVSAAGTVISVTKYKEVIDSLEVTPQVYADGSIGLKTKAVIGSKSTPEGTSQNTIITKRTIEVEENRIRPGDSLIIGGIRKSERLGIIRGVPGLQDLPIIGVLFSSKDKEERVKEILFILTPSISHTGTDYTKMVEDIREKHAKPEREKSFVEQMIDPFGKGAYTEHIEQQAAKAEAKLVKVEEEIIEAEAQVEKAEIEAEKAIAEKTEAEAEKGEAIKAKDIAEVEKTEAEKARAEAEAQAKADVEAKVKAEAEKATAMAAQAEAEAKAKADEEAKTQAEAEKAEAIKAKTQAEARAQATTEQAQAEAEKAKAEAEKARAEVEKAKAEAEKARAEADQAKLEAAQAKADSEARAKADADAKAKAEADAKAKADAEAQAAIDANDANSPAE